MSERHVSVEITDAVDFYSQWPKLRSQAEQMAKSYALDDADAELLFWMIKMVDMVGPKDIVRDK
ncbi:hypothetical protein [Marivita sp.]|uniref:hypothetical protein n=1 Tax=Marivita sp. TaxID=2003365 RepID=UPI003F6B372F